MPQGTHNKNWRGGRLVTKQGYATVRVYPDDPFFEMAYSDGRGEWRILEHRLVMARKLGRPLLRSESVHHINGARADNAEENLQLRASRGHGAGQAYVCLDCGSHNVQAVGLRERRAAYG